MSRCAFPRSRDELRGAEEDPARFSLRTLPCEKPVFLGLVGNLGNRQVAPCGLDTLLNWRLAMAISKDLLEILVCPLCKATVELKPDQSGLKCVQCHRVYPIRDDIPVMLVDEAKIEE